MDAEFIHCQEHMINRALKAVMPDRAVKDAVAEIDCDGRLFVVSAGKAAWQMANASYSVLGDRIQRGIVITKYGHVREEIPKFICFEAGHPVPDENTFNATEKAVEMVRDLDKKDKVLFLLSGGGSALFEKPLIPFEELKYITQKLLASGADIREINTVRKHLSAVKGGRFAEICSPTSVFTVVLSDVLGNDPAIIASGPTCADSSTCGEALDVINKYGIPLSEEAQLAIRKETPKELLNSEISVNGSVKELCTAAAEAAGLYSVSPHLRMKPPYLRTNFPAKQRMRDHFWEPLPCFIRTPGKAWLSSQAGKQLLKLPGRVREVATRNWFWLRQRN